MYCVGLRRNDLFILKIACLIILTDHESEGVPSVDSDTPTVLHSLCHCVPRKVIHRLVDQGKYHQYHQYTVADSIEIEFLFS